MVLPARVSAPPQFCVPLVDTAPPLTVAGPLTLRLANGVVAPTAPLKVVPVALTTRAEAPSSAPPKLTLAAVSVLSCASVAGALMAMEAPGALRLASDTVLAVNVMPPVPALIVGVVAPSAPRLMAPVATAFRPGVKLTAAALTPVATLMSPELDRFTMPATVEGVLTPER